MVLLVFLILGFFSSVYAETDPCPHDFELVYYHQFEFNYRGVQAKELLDKMSKEFYSREIFWSPGVCKTLTLKKEDGSVVRIKFSPVDVSGFVNYGWMSDIYSEEADQKRLKQVLSDNMVSPSGSELHLYKNAKLVKAVEIAQISDGEIGAKEILNFFNDDLKKSYPEEKVSLPLKKNSSLDSTQESAVIFIGSAVNPNHNPITNAKKVTDAQSAIETRAPNAQVRYLFGSGKEKGPDIIEATEHSPDDGEDFWYTKDVKISAEAPFNADSLKKLNEEFKEKNVKRRLWVHVGHADPKGLYIWKENGKLMSPDRWEELTYDRNSIDVTIGSPCYAGQFALATTCGFFSAPPDLKSQTCSEDPSDYITSNYYGRFFEAIDKKNESAADVDGDGKVSFAEAHWYSALHMDRREIPYTSLDALADTLFDSNFKYKEMLPDFELPETIGRVDLRQMIGKYASENEKKYYDDALDLPCLNCPPLNLKIEDNTSNIKQRGLVQMARRLFLAKVTEQYPKTKIAQASRNIRKCEGQTVDDFLKPKPDLAKEPAPKNPLEYFCPYENEVLNKKQQKQIADLKLKMEELSPNEVYPLHDTEHDGRLKDSKKISIIIFKADWCGVCKEIYPGLEKYISKSKNKDIQFFSVNIDNEPDLTEKYKVFSLPLVVGVKEEKEIFRIESQSSKEAYLQEFTSKLIVLGKD